MKTSLYKLILLAGIFFSGSIALTSCSKADAIDSISTQRSSLGGVTANILFDHNLIVTYAKDDGADITSSFNGITFNFIGSPDYMGYGSAANDLFAVNGNWYLNNNRTIISFAFPTNHLSVLNFMNKEWNIVNSSGPVVLTAANGENDEVDLVVKK